MGREQAQTVEIPIVMNRASLGDSPYPYAVLRAREGSTPIVAWVPKERVMIDAQKVRSTFTGQLSADVVEERGDELLVETDSMGEGIRLLVDRKTGLVLRKVATKPHGYPHWCDFVSL